MTAPEEREHPKRSKVSRLAIAAAVLALIPPTIWLAGVVVYVVQIGALGAGALAAVLAIIALPRSVRRRDWRGVGLCTVALTVATLILFSGLLRFHRKMQEYRRLGTVYHTLLYIHRAVWHFYENTGHAPRSVDELIEAGLLEGDRAFLRTYVLAPLDDCFSDEDLWDQVAGKVLCVYRPAGYEDGSGEWLYMAVRGPVGALPAAEVRQWLENQREAITWLDEGFPLAELKQIAEDGESWRAKMAAGVLKYRQAKARREEREVQDLAPKG